MNQFKTIFKFEYSNYIKNKAFLIITAVLLAIVILASNIPNIRTVYQNITQSKSETPSDSEDSGKIPSAVIADISGQYSSDILQAYIPGYNWTRQDNLAGIEEKIESGDYEFAVEINALDYKLYLKGSGSMFSTAQRQIESMIKSVYQVSELQNSGLTQDEIVKVLDAAPSGEVIPVGRDITQSFWVSYAVLFLMYMVTLMYGQYVLTSVITEKSSKAMELLITSARPFQLMLGKVLGVGAAGLTQFGLIMISAFVALKLNFDAWESFQPAIAAVLNLSISSNLFIYAVIFFMLGFFMFSFVYAAVGSTVSRMEDANAAVLLPTLLFVAAFMIAMFGMYNAEAFYIKVCSFIPFLSPMIMFMRICITELPLWQILLAIVLNIAYILLSALVCSRIYKVGVMLYGKRPNIKDIIKYIAR